MKVDSKQWEIRETRHVISPSLPSLFPLPPSLPNK